MQQDRQQIVDTNCNGWYTCHMSDDPKNTPADAQPAPDGKTPRVHLLVQRETHELLEATRVAIRRAGLAHVPPDVARILEQDWTSDTLVFAGCTAIQTLLQPPQSPQPEEKFGVVVENYIAKVIEKSGATRHNAIESIIGWEKSRADAFAPHAGSVAPDLGSPTDVAIRSFQKDTTVKVPVRDVPPLSKPAAKSKARR